jgi:hypothetical protein
MEIEVAGARSGVFDNKKKPQAIYVPDGQKLTDILPQFQQRNNLELNTGMLKLAFGDLVANLRGDRISQHELHKSAFGQYGRYTVDLFFSLQKHGFDAHIDILDNVAIISVIVLDIDQKTVRSIHPLIKDGGELLGIQKIAELEIGEIIAWLSNHEDKKETKDATA